VLSLPAVGTIATASVVASLCRLLPSRVRSSATAEQRYPSQPPFPESGTCTDWEQFSQTLTPAVQCWSFFLL